MAEVEVGAGRWPHGKCFHPPTAPRPQQPAARLAGQSGSGQLAGPTTGTHVPTHQCSARRWGRQLPAVLHTAHHAMAASSIPPVTAVMTCDICHTCCICHACPVHSQRQSKQLPAGPPAGRLAGGAGVRWPHPACQLAPAPACPCHLARLLSHLTRAHPCCSTDRFPSAPAPSTPSSSASPPHTTLSPPPWLLPCRCPSAGSAGPGCFCRPGTRSQAEWLLTLRHLPGERADWSGLGWAGLPPTHTT